MNTRCVAIVISLSWVWACSSSTKTQGSGGATGSGGVTLTGGSAASGGATGSGGASGPQGSGGTTVMGGSSGTGGSVITGGATGSGGTTTQPATGGTTGKGGGSGSGGVTSTGGTTGPQGSGGATGKGGGSGTGGVVSTGGATGKGGSGGTGGSTSASTSGCTRDMLQKAVDSYLAALKTGDTSGMALTSSAKYNENGATVALGSGLWAAPLTPDLTMNLLDVTLCGSYTEVIAASASHPYIFGARLAVEASTGKISVITVIVTDCDDWGFNAKTYLTEAKAEQTNTAAGSGWGPVDPSDQYTRDELLAGGKAYFAYWGDKTAVVPWGKPCCRTEGGMVTNSDPKPDKTKDCSVGIPDQTSAPRVTDQLADVDYGMVVDFLGLPGPDSHWFRFTKSTDMRYVHTLTICYVNGSWQCPGSAPVCSN